ncbi:hypothetical protein C0991_004273 [Blastosporella zonata]|nr:hypothetical protein C0991_004273 [Blastosporella zonata]
MRAARHLSEAKEHETIVEREQRSIANAARMNDLFRDLKYMEEGIENIKQNQLAAGPETGKSHKILVLA